MKPIKYFHKNLNLP